MAWDIRLFSIHPVVLRQYFDNPDFVPPGFSNLLPIFAEIAQIAHITENRIGAEIERYHACHVEKSEIKSRALQPYETENTCATNCASTLFRRRSGDALPMEE